MLLKCRATHVLCVIWDAEFGGDINCKKWLEERSISGQTMSNLVKFENSKFSDNNIPSCPVLSQASKKCHLFQYTATGNARNRV